jgi:hypothetical protein
MPRESAEGPRQGLSPRNLPIRKTDQRQIRGSSTSEFSKFPGGLLALSPDISPITPEKIFKEINEPESDRERKA